MAFTGIENLDRSIHKANAWLGDVAEGFGTDDRHFAYRVLRAWLHTLRDRLSVDLAAHLAAGFPELIRRVFYDGWHPAGLPHKYGRAEFVDRFVQEARVAHDDAQEKIAVVSGVIRGHLGNGAFDHTVQQLPQELRQLLAPDLALRDPVSGHTGQ